MMRPSVNFTVLQKSKKLLHAGLCFLTNPFTQSHRSVKQRGLLLQLPRHNFRLVNIVLAVAIGCALPLHASNLAISRRHAVPPPPVSHSVKAINAIRIPFTNAPTIALYPPSPAELKNVNGFIMAMCADQTGRTWIGTESDGVYRFDPHLPTDKRWRHFTTADGLGDDSVYAICCDRFGRIWTGSADPASRCSTDEPGKPTTRLPGRSDVIFTQWQRRRLPATSGWPPSAGSRDTH